MTAVHTTAEGTERAVFPAVAVPAILRGAARRYGDRVAFHCAGRAVSFRALAADAHAFAAGLARHGIGPGDVLALHLPNSAEFAVGYYGTLLAGATAAPVNPLLAADRPGRPTGRLRGHRGPHRPAGRAGRGRRPRRDPGAPGGPGTRHRPGPSLSGTRNPLR